MNGTPWPTKIPGIESPEEADRVLYQTVQDNVYLHFKYRQVCDNTRFADYFHDTLNRSYRRFNELSRIEPGISKFDWMVEEYLESERTHTGKGSETKDSNADKTSHKGQSITVSDNGSNSTAHTGTVTTSDKTGSESNTTGNQTTTYNGSKTVTENGNTSEKTDYTGSETRNAVRTPELKTAVKDTGKNTTDTTNRSMAKAMPMEASYNAAAGGDLPQLNWSNPSSQAQTEVKDTQNTESNSETNSTGKETTNETKSFTGRSDSKTGSGHKETAESFSDRSDTVNGTETVKTSGTNDGKTTYDEHNGGTSNRTMITSFGDGEDSEKTTGKEAVNSQEEAIDREIHTGRHGNVSDILASAQDYIKSSSAFKWLIAQLEEDFLQIFDVDDLYDSISIW